jgi:DNA-binding transcriptional LysR family regulator
MDLNHLRSFVTVAKFAHLTRAAEALHLSQPAISGHIKVLEEQLGVSLFDRTSSGMTLTPSGRQLLAEAEHIIEAVQHMQHSAQELRGQPTGHVKLGTVLDPASLRVGDLLMRALERYPQIELELHHVMSSDALAQVRNGALDASFYFGAEPGPDRGSVPLRDITYRVVLPAAWSDELRDAPWEALAERPWVVAPEPSSHRQLVLELFGDTGPPQRIIEADNESVIINLVETGVGISLIRDEFAPRLTAGGRAVICPSRAVTTRLWAVCQASRVSDPLIVALRDVLAEVWADAPAVAATAAPAA